MLQQIFISPRITSALMMWTIYFNGEEVPMWNWSNPASEQSKLPFRSLVGPLQATRQAPEQDIYTIPTKADFQFRMKPCCYQKITGLPELRTIQIRTVIDHLFLTASFTLAAQITTVSPVR
jgi:hypothetical protein